MKNIKTYANIMDRKTIIIILVSLLIIAEIIYVVVHQGTPPGSPLAPGRSPSAPYLGSKTWAPVPSGTIIPGQNDTKVPFGVAIPDAVLAASIGSDANFRLFRVSIAKIVFSPNTVVAREGDTIRLILKGVDKDYDFVQPDMGLSSKLSKGVEKVVEFSGMSTGKYTFYCASCGGPDKGPVGYIVVVPKQQ